MFIFLAGIWGLQPSTEIPHFSGALFCPVIWAIYVLTKSGYQHRWLKPYSYCYSNWSEYLEKKNWYWYEHYTSRLSEIVWHHFPSLNCKYNSLIYHQQFLESVISYCKSYAPIMSYSDQFSSHFPYFHIFRIVVYWYDL